MERKEAGRSCDRKTHDTTDDNGKHMIGKHMTGKMQMKHVHNPRKRQHLQECHKERSRTIQTQPMRMNP